MTYNSCNGLSRKQPLWSQILSRPCHALWNVACFFLSNLFVVLDIQQSWIRTRNTRSKLLHRTSTSRKVLAIISRYQTDAYLPMVQLDYFITGIQDSNPALIHRYHQPAKQSFPRCEKIARSALRTFRRTRATSMILPHSRGVNAPHVLVERKLLNRS